jgi:hypothetical protein
MPIPKDEKLYKKIKKTADIVYSHPSAYKSGFLVSHYVKEFKKKYGDDVSPYINDGKEKTLKRWYKERWSDIGNKEYPTYRPTIRINKHTPLTVDEIDKKNLKEQIKLKQIIKGTRNLPPFKKSI